MAFLILYFFNLVLDYPLQDEFMKQYKSKSNYVLFVHCAIWGLGLSLMLVFLKIFALWKLIMLVAGHFAIDYWKCHRLYLKWPLKRKSKLPIISDWGSLYIDQSLHVVQLLLCLI
jgi:hypothetical protein